LPLIIELYSYPQYLKPASQDPHVQWTMQGMEEMMWGQPGPLRGQLGLVYIFQVRVQYQHQLFIIIKGMEGQLGPIYMVWCASQAL